MAYSTSNPPVLLQQSIGGVAPNLWSYISVDPSATLDAAGYITNGGNLGMKVNDLVYAFDTTNNIGTMHRVVSVSSTAPGAVNLGDGTTVASATNTD